MKLDRLETHDRLLHLIKDQSAMIVKGCEDCLFRNPKSLAIQEKSHYVYIYGHARTADNGVDKIIFWDPRLCKPYPETNSFLFRAKSKTDILEECWIIPERHLWYQYRTGNITEHKTVLWSIDQYLNNRIKLAEPDPDDFPEERAKELLRQIIDEKRQEIRQNKMMEKLYSTQQNEEEFSTSSD